MAWSLPKLPGCSFPDPTRTSFSVPRKFEMVNGFAMPVIDFRGVGGIPMDVEGSRYLDVTDNCSYDPSLTYGRVKAKEFPITLPNWVHYDKKKLSFRGFLRQSISESPLEYFRIRPIILMYYLENDTMAIAEPPIENSGLWHGKLVARDKIPKNDNGEFWHWKDLNVGIDIPIFGKVFHLVQCDDFTKEFLESQGIELAQEEEMPDDPYTKAQQFKRAHNPRKVVKKKDTLKKFLQYDGKVLKFDAVWDDRATEYGELRECQVFYYLTDDMISIKECHTANDGRDPVSTLLRKMRIPRNWKDRTVDAPFVVHEPIITDANEQEYFRPGDLVVGTTVNILGRPFILYDCDNFTRHYYSKVVNLEQPEKVDKPEDLRNVKPLRPQRDSCELKMPENDGFMVEPTAQDVVMMALNASKKLRYLCEMVAMNPENEGRTFTLAYHLANGAIKLDELAAKNSGRAAKCFSRLTRVRIPGSDRFYTPDMLHIGAIVVINSHKFRITGCDLYVYRYMQEHPDKFPQHVVDSVRNYHLLQGHLKHDVNDATADLLSRKEEKPEPIVSSEQDTCLQSLGAIPKPPEPYVVPTVDYGECREYEASPRNPYQLPLPRALQGLSLDSPKEKSIVCFTGPKLPSRDANGRNSVESNARRSATDDGETSASKQEPLGICKKSVTFAQSPRNACQ